MSHIYLENGLTFEVSESIDDIRRKVRGDSDKIIDFTCTDQGDDYSLIIRNDKFVAATSITTPL